LLSVEFGDGDRERMEYLADRCGEGALTPDEEAEFDSYPMRTAIDGRVVVSRVLCKLCSLKASVLSSFPPEPPVAPTSGLQTARSGQGRAASRRGASEPLPASTVLRFRMQTGGSGGYEDLASRW
jgi:hypothetical protein